MDILKRLIQMKICGKFLWIDSKTIDYIKYIKKAVFLGTAFLFTLRHLYFLYDRFQLMPDATNILSVH